MSNNFIEILNYFNVSLFIGGIIAIVSSALVYISDSKKPENVHWFLSNIFAGIWSFGYAVMITTTDHDVAVGANLILHAAAIFIPLFYLSFILNLTGTRVSNRYILYFFSGLSIIFLVVNFSRVFVSSVIPKFVFNFAPNAGPAYIYFTAYFFILVLYSLFVLGRALREDKQNKLFKFIFYTSVLGFGGGGSVFFLTFNIGFPPYPVILFSLYPMVISYAILRHHVFNVRIIATETFVILLWLIMLLRTLLSNNTSEQIFNGGMLLGTLIIGVLLLKSVMKEVHIREKMEILATQLAEANERLTVLDRQKSEFLSIASHQLRSPLTAIKGYSSMILEGSFGKITDGKLKEAIERIFLSSERLVIIIEDFLNVSRIEQGRMQYDFSTVNLEELVEGAIEELKPNITKAGLSIEFEKGSEGPFYTHADFGKVRQMVINIIDNAVKYTPKGSINVTIERKEGRKILISVADTGIGIPRDVLPNLFQKFTRAKGAGQVNTQGTGLGLYVVKELMKAHKGHVWADSPGEGEGSTFYLEFLAE